MDRNQIQRIVKASGVAPGELVLVHYWGEAEHLPVAQDFMAAVAALGASPVLLQQSRSRNCILFAEAQAPCFGPAYFGGLSHFDTVLDLFACQPILLGSALPEPQMARYRNYIAALFSALMKARRFVQLRLPTAENAAETGIPDYMERLEAAYGADYEALLARCREAKDALEGHDRLTLRTGADCALHFDLSGRTWLVDAGEGDWPCGEIYIAPLEGGTAGTVWFPALHLEDVGCFSDVTLTVEGGRVVDSSAPALRDFFRQQPPENRVVCELGLGMNPEVRSLCGCAALDEKMAGSFHIALGANTMFGGQNEARIHTDLVGTGPFTLQ